MGLEVFNELQLLKWVTLRYSRENLAYLFMLDLGWQWNVLSMALKRIDLKEIK